MRGSLTFPHCTDNFDTLADLLISYPAIMSQSQFVFVPGPLDPWGSSMLPRPALPSPFTSRFRSKVQSAYGAGSRIHFTSNPVRLKFFGQEIVVMRQDLMDRMLANLVGVKPDLTAGDTKRFVSEMVFIVH